MAMLLHLICSIWLGGRQAEEGAQGGCYWRFGGVRLTHALPLPWWGGELWRGWEQKEAPCACLILAYLIVVR